MNYSKQRELALKVLQKNMCHPTADFVYEQMRKDLPNISLATVYRNLNQLAAQGEILRVPVPTGADHFDFNIKPHYHVRCTKCGGVFDVFMPPVTDLIDRVEDSSGVELHRYEILFEGICSACRKD